jgi:hypothetical protein
VRPAVIYHGSNLRWLLILQVGKPTVWKFIKKNYQIATLHIPESTNYPSVLNDNVCVNFFFAKE